MRRWFSGLPIHRKLLVISIAIVTPALLVATVVIGAIEVVRTRRLMVNDTMSLAGVIAENTAAAVVFGDSDDAGRMLSALRVRPNIRKACLYLPNGTLFFGYAQPEFSACHPTMPDSAPWTLVVGRASIVRSGRSFGTVYVERELSDQWPRIYTTAIVNVAVLEALGIAALLFAGRLQRQVAQPIADLSAAASRIDPNAPHPELPVMNSGVGEVDGLSRSLADMLGRLHRANQEVRLREQECADLLVREREANRMKDDFLAAVSHELRTPLNVIATWSQVLISTPVDEHTLTTAIAAIHRNARAQARLIDDLVDVSRIATGKFSLTWSTVDLRSVVTDAVEAIRPAATTKGVRLETILPADACMVDGDRQRLQQAVSNVLENAVKFSQTGGAVSLHLGREANGCVLAITDSGAGIDHAFLPFVFEAFRQGDGSLTRRHDGLGLGLAIVKQILELHGGTIEAMSEGPARGATFTLRIPSAHPTVVAGRDAKAPQVGQVLSGIRAMVVDDNEDAAETLAMALRLGGASARVATSGASAVAKWQQQPADILLCDLSMPGMDGFEVLRRVREVDAQHGRETRAISVSAHATSGYVERSRAAGFAAHIGKPYQLEHIFRLVKDVLDAAER